MAENLQDEFLDLTSKHEPYKGKVELDLIPLNTITLQKVIERICWTCSIL